MCAICLFGCGVAALNGGPRTTDGIYGNGGFSVVKGDYLYFSNAYYDYNNLNEGENKYDFNSPKKLYGIYRVKLNENKLVNLDENGFPVGAELMVPQVGAYAYSGLYICGNYLYYTTPFTGNKSGTYVKGLITFERVNLNRTGHKILYRMEDYSSSCKYYLNYINGVTYITILDVNSNVISVAVQGENIQTKTIATGVSTLFAPEQTELSHNEEINSCSTYIYYTKKDGDYYSMYKKSLVNNSEAAQMLVGPTTNEVEVLQVKNDRVYYKENKILKSSNFENNVEPKIYTNQQLAGDDENGIKSYYVLDDTNGTRLDRGVACVCYDGSSYSVNVYNGSSYQFLFSNSSQINILYAYNNNVYYKLADDDALYCFNMSNSNNSKIAKEFLTSIDDASNVYDFNCYHGYYFSTVESANNTVKYLHVVSLNGFGYEDENGELVGQYVGVLDASRMN